MGRLKPSTIVVVVLVLAVAAGGYFFIDSLGKGGTRTASVPVIPVTAGVVEQRDMPVYVRGIGTVQAFKTVAIKTRVDGQIVKIAFEEGQDVKKGDPLFQIDPRPFQALLEQAQAAKQRDEAQLVGAKLDLERYGKLIGSGFQSRQSLDQQQATVDALKGSVASDQAQIDTAQLNLTYADIRAPVDGRTGQRLVDLGNLVQAAQGTTLVSITQIKPIFVNFTVPQDATEEIRRNQQAEPLSVIAYAADDTTELARGKVTLIDNQIEPTTGTLRLKATFENTDERLWPGQFVNARLQLSVRTKAMTVTQRAVMQGATGYYAFIVKPDNTVERRDIVVSGTQDGLAIVTKGMQIGEKIVSDGQYRLVNGSRVKVDAPRPQAETPPPAAAGKEG
jgi:membrane fusion protein, multidrug efflux system